MAAGQGHLNATSMERALHDRLDRATAHPGDWRAVAAPDHRDIAIDQVPLILLGAGSVLARPLVRYALERWRVVGLLDNARVGETQGDCPIIGDADLPSLIARFPDAVGVLCCGSDGAVAHFVGLWHPTGRPLLSLFEAQFAAGQTPGGHALGTATEIAALLDATSLRQSLADETSRETFLSVLLFRLTGDMRWLHPVRLSYRSMYFATDALALHDDEVLVDGGAFDGDTVAMFTEQTRGQYRHVHAFEADPANLPGLARRTAGLLGVTIHPIGLWDGPGTLRFSSGQGPAGRLGGKGNVEVPVQALDDLGLGPVSLIKLDIEGAEIQALRGAADIIARQRPRLAVAIYHSPADFTAIPALIETLRPGSQYRLRHHSPMHHDTVLYVE